MAPSAPTKRELAQQEERLDRRTKTHKEAYMKSMDSWIKSSEGCMEVQAQLQKLGQVNAAKRTQLQQKLGEEKSAAEVLLNTVKRHDEVLNRTLKDKQAYVKYIQDTHMLVKLQNRRLPPEIAQMICAYEYRKRFSWDDDE